VEDRAVPGHWEGDLIIGEGRSCIGTLVERSTRYVMLMQLGRGTAEQVRNAMAKKITQLPDELRRSITWDSQNAHADHLEHCELRNEWWAKMIGGRLSRVA
jgi:IS30 family transposase